MGARRGGKVMNPGKGIYLSNLSFLSLSILLLSSPVYFFIFSILN